MGDTRNLETVRSNPGIYRRHTESCTRNGRCACAYVVRWKDRDGRGHKQMFPSLELAREFKRSLWAKSSRRPLSSKTVGDYFPTWLQSYRGRTARGLEESSRREYEMSFRLHILPLTIARIRMRELGAPDLKDWFSDLERQQRRRLGHHPRAGWPQRWPHKRSTRVADRRKSNGYGALVSK